MLYNVLIRAKERQSKYPRSYYDALYKYADYLREYEIDINKSIEYYEECIDLLGDNIQNSMLKNTLLTGYALSLTDSGKSDKAITIIQSLLFPDEDTTHLEGRFINPDINSLKIDKQSLLVLKAKYKILSDIYNKSNNTDLLITRANTSELIISLIEKLRINMSEEESRLILGDQYREFYINAINDFYVLYNNTSENNFLKKAFEYSEKSKVAGLLASTRELKAIQFHVPSDISDFEKEIQRNLSLLNERIIAETAKEEPDYNLISSWKENILVSTRLRDSLILVFEKQYPDYYSIKYNTMVSSLNEIPGIIGHNTNYVSYVVSDKMLYIFIVNRKKQQLLALPIDTSFLENVKEFRKLLSNPIQSYDAREAFEKFQTIGYGLYTKLLEPVSPYLISDKILISPDNILSYIPFEALPASELVTDNLFYRNLYYAMDKYDISYTYSATFMKESHKAKYEKTNSTLIFAPDYPEPIDIQTVLLNRQSKQGVLLDLPYAREEANYVSKLTGGKLYLNSDAKESVFKNEAGKYDIIHLAMHTLVNDTDPMRSTLIFNTKDSTDDGYLKTYEIYGIPLKAKMVVLSSCNTGSGVLSSGEGILSLARGFIYSGSQSVVMSMWEIEDRSGTEIVKKFYEYLKNGNTKSVALRKARIAYLHSADQLRSHPYFWSTLVIYGDNAPLYHSKYLITYFIIRADLHTITGSLLFKET